MFAVCNISRTVIRRNARIVSFQQHLQFLSSSVNSSEFTSDSVPILNGFLRQPKFMGSRLSRYMRKELGQLPGVIYGVDEWGDDDTTETQKHQQQISNSNSGSNHSSSGSGSRHGKKEYQHFRYDARDIKIPVQVDILTVERELTRLGRQFESTCYELVLDDNTRHYVFPRQVQIDPLTDRPTAVNFIKLRRHNKLRIPFQFVNAEHSADLFSKGSYLIKVNRYLDCVVEGFVKGADGVTRVNTAIPAAIPVDLGGVKTGDIVRLNTKQAGHGSGSAGSSIVNIPAGVYINKKACRPDMLIGVVKAGTK